MSKIRFCPKCDNNFSNYNLEESDSGELVLKYKCSSCLFVEEISSEELPKHALLYTKTNLNQKPDRVMNAEMCDDMSLPRTSTVPCPNKECPSNSKNIEPEVVFMDYNEERKIAFICCYCHTMWKKE